MLKAVNDDDLKEGFEWLLRYFDTGIEGIDLKDVEFDKLGISQDLQQIIRSDLSKATNADAFGSLRFENDLYLITYSEGEIKAKKLTTIHNVLTTME